ncbi:hypothetical protein [Pelotalea chapellei]|uniref:Uncharacterized protein n=1 Tax=Pelotalea chapellei TaxID=44671 RepID=A0ABS5U808_9BACT|nr:hypothetical protein [Pelotalea chapellei]MBT1071801.1 hypothetical protein [Pelotalea chapellei]
MRFPFLLFLLFFLVLISPSLPSAATDAVIFEQAVSETLDLWREGRYEQLFDRLAHRGKMSRERFAIRMRETSIRPACCWQKMEHLSVLSEKRTTATIYVKVGLEGTPNPVDSSTREFKLTNEAGLWKMQLADISSLAGMSTVKKSRHSKKHISH